MILENTWSHVESKHMWGHRVDASTKTMKYLNGPNNG
jgi:hypothetical protein